MTSAERHVLHTDGGARGNPGPAGIGFVLSTPAGETLADGGRYLGEATNNVAEYEALLWGLAEARRYGAEDLDAKVDSELIVKQISGEYRVKDQKLAPLYTRVIEELDEFRSVTVTHVPREQNTAADALVNTALDEQLGIEPAVATGAGAGRDGRWHLTVKAHFDAAHALQGYPGECRELHGHTWDVEVTVVGSTLDAVGIVYDFKRLKADLGAVLEPFDHAHLNEVPPFDEMNPTAENLASHVCGALQETVGAEVTVTEVAVWESPIARIAYRPE